MCLFGYYLRGILHRSLFYLCFSVFFVGSYEVRWQNYVLFEYTQAYLWEKNRIFSNEVLLFEIILLLKLLDLVAVVIQIDWIIFITHGADDSFFCDNSSIPRNSPYRESPRRLSDNVSDSRTSPSRVPSRDRDF